MKIESEFVDKNSKRFDLIALSVLILLIMGAWVSSTAGGQYNQSCSVGFPDGWPQCNGQFLPSLDNSGILVQMIHHVELVVGLILIGSFMKMDNNTASNSSNAAFLSSLKFTTILWFANLFVGATYIIQAKVGDFPEWISLLHLLIGVSTFLAAMCGPMMFRLSGSNLGSENE